MLCVPFIQNQFYEDNTRSLEERLSTFLRMLRRRYDKSTEEDGAAKDCSLDGYKYGDKPPVILSRGDTQTIRRRAEKIVKARRARSGLSHLTDEEILALSKMKDGVRLKELGSVDWADELAAELHSEFPWLSPVTKEVWLALRRLASAGPGPIALPPILLVGPPGIGKSAWARHLAHLCRLPATVIEIGSGSSNFRISGLERGWKSAAPGRPLQTIMQHDIANPVIVVDEICKDHGADNGSGAVASASEGLLSLLEPLTAARWECPYYRVGFNMSHVNWLLTANDLTRVSEPLRSRCLVVELDYPSLDALSNFAGRQGKRRGITDDSVAAIQEVIWKVGGKGKQFSLRTVSRMIDRAIAMETRPLLN